MVPFRNFANAPENEMTACQMFGHLHSFTLVTAGIKEGVPFFPVFAAILNNDSLLILSTKKKEKGSYLY
jgi:hypothetical protein